MHGKKQFCWSI